MKTVGITGANGFLGWHVRSHLLVRGIPFRTAERTTFADRELLDAFVSECDLIVHLAGVNRASTDDEIWNGNTQPAKLLTESIARCPKPVDVAYANSIAADNPGVYGESKADAAETLRTAQASQGARFVDVRLPHIYGEFGRPHYNSVVATFAHQLVRGETSTVSDGDLRLLHAQDAARMLVDAIELTADDALKPNGRPITVTECYARMRRMADSYVDEHTVPLLEDDEFDLRLFNTIRSQMWPSMYPVSLTKHADSRGSFFEVVRASGQGQTSISTTVPGVTRGEHFHVDKIERFAVIAGQARIRVRRLFSPEVATFEVSGESPVFIDMPTFCTHDITNVGESELVTLFWSHDHFDPKNADTYPLPVVGEDLPA